MTTEISVKKVEVLEQWKGSGILEDNERGGKPVEIRAHPKCEDVCHVMIERYLMMAHEGHKLILTPSHLHLP